MNLTPINKFKLQELFDKFDYLPNENKITLLGSYEKKVNQQVGAGRTKFNPNYKYFKVYDDDGNVIESVDTAKVVIQVPAKNRVNEDGSPYRISIPLFTVGNGVKKIKELDEIYTEPKEYIYCTGAIQNFYVSRQNSPDPKMLEFLDKWMRMYRGEYDEQLATKMLKILRMGLDEKDGVQIPMLNVWIHEIINGSFMYRELFDKKKDTRINKAEITGLAYMPPSLRFSPDGRSGRVHFKVRVKRNDPEGQSIPIAQQSRDGYDIINVIYQGDLAGEYFEAIRQGYPVKVSGSLENHRYSQKFSVNVIEQRELAELLGVNVQSNKVQDIVQFLDRAKLTESIPSYNIVADEIRTDYLNW